MSGSNGGGGRVTFEQLCECVRGFVRGNFGGREPTRVVIHFSEGEPFSSPLADAGGAAECRHSPDFRHVVWFGREYRFSPTQAAVIRQLWQAWEDGVPEMGGAALLEGAGSESGRVRDLFRDHAAWGDMVAPGSKGAYRLVAPDDLG